MNGMMMMMLRMMDVDQQFLRMMMLKKIDCVGGLGRQHWEFYEAACFASSLLLFYDMMMTWSDDF